MAYGLRYYKELTHPDGKVVRLEILEKGGTFAAKEIGPVCQALRLDIQGDTEIDAPIVKTSLSMTFVDAPDHAEANVKKCGNWDEFYTSDATLWRVVVKIKKAQGTAFTTIWTGYITPDSYTEVLTYRGSVTIVARDNIGHMNDFPFDAEGDENGMISLLELVEDAWAKIENPMEVLFFGQDWLLSEGVPAFNTRMNVSAFEGKTWFEALESALYGYGATLRWIGGNEVIVRPLRFLPYVGRLAHQDIITAEPVFMSGAERELSPAAKIIEEVAEYDIDNVFVKPPKTTDFSGETIEVGYYQRELWPLANTEQGKGWANASKNATLFVNPKAYGFLEGFMIDEDKENIYNEIYINGGLTGDVEYSRIINSRNFSLELNLGRILLFEKDFSDPSANWQIASATNSRINSIVYSISISKNGITKWLHEDGSWAAGEVSLTHNKGENETISSMKVALNLEEFIGDVLFSFHIKSIQIDQNDTQKCVSLTGLKLICDDILCEKNNVNTIYNDTNNVILSRDVKIAPSLNTPFLPQVIRNGIFVKEGNIYKPAKLWAWEGETPQQMAVYNHLQLLCYHAKPNNILRGTIVNADNTDMQPVWMWGGAEHMLVSGSLNFLNGYIENAVLREFARYEDMWGALQPADFPDVEGKSRTTAENGTATTNEGARTTNTTTVNIGGGGGTITLDTFMSDISTNGVQNRIIKAYVDGMGADITEAYTTAVSSLNTQIAAINSAKQDAITASNKLPYSLISGTPTIPTVPTKVSAFTNDAKYATQDDVSGEISDLQTQLKDWVAEQSYIKGINSAMVTNALGYTPLSTGGGTMSGDIAMSVNTFLRDEVGNAMIGYNGTLVRVGNTARATDIKGSSVTINGNTPITSANIANQSVGTAKSLITSNGLTFADFTSSIVNIGAGTYSNYQTHIYGNAIRLRYGNNGEIGLILNSNGNITVGNTDAASTDYRFYVYGNMRVREQALVGNLKIGTPNDNYFATLKMDGSSLSIDRELKLLAGGTSDICPSIAASFKAKISQIQNLITNNVIIGASSGTASNLAFNVQKYTSISSQAPAGLTTLFSIGTDGKATFNGDVVVNGNLIVNGDTSSGGSGSNTPASGTVTGIKVNGIAYEPTNGIVTLPDYPSSLAWSSISGKPTTLAGYGITDGLTASALAGYMPKAGGTFSGEITAFNLAISNTGTGYHLQFKRGGGNIIWCPAGGYYRIVCNGAGTSDGDATLLIKSGNVSVKGNLSASGTVTNGSDIRFKDIIEYKTIRIEDIANAPLFTFKWNDREDDIIHMGSSAQYWENVVPELVIGEGFKTMDYSTLGVAIGISLANKTINLEERVKVLEEENNALKAQMRRICDGC